MIEIKKSLQKHFGFEQGFYWNKTLDEFRDDIIDAIANNQALAIVGAAGAGKNVLYDSAVEAIKENIIFVNVRNYYKEKLDVSSIINAVIYDIGEEIPRRDLEARSRQFIRLVGKKKVNENVLISILINEGHRLHTNTFRAIKELHEASFAGHSPLFSLIVTGQSGLGDKVKDKNEVLFRFKMIELDEKNNYYTYQQRVAYISKVFGRAVNDEAARRIAAICFYPLEINFYIEQKMEEAKKAGKKIIDGEVVKPKNKQLKEALNLSLKDIADETGFGKTTIHDILVSPEHPKSEEVRLAIERLYQKQTGKKISFGKTGS
jgi:type II secretory pathway predicted ATPase ExeA